MLALFKVKFRQQLSHFGISDKKYIHNKVKNPLPDQSTHWGEIDRLLHISYHSQSILYVWLKMIGFLHQLHKYSFIGIWLGKSKGLMNSLSLEDAAIIFKLITQNSSLGPCCDIVLRWMPQDLTNEKSTLFQVITWCCQATSHCQNQCRPKSKSSYGITRQQCVNSTWLGVQYMCHKNSFRFHSDALVQIQNALLLSL